VKTAVRKVGGGCQEGITLKFFMEFFGSSKAGDARQVCDRFLDFRDFYSTLRFSSWGK
jgi:hypothetical protein